MFSRSEFLHGLIVGALTAASPSPSPKAGDKSDSGVACSKNAALPYDRPLEIRLPVLDGPEFRLSDYSGRWVLLNIFATWCEPCKYETPYLVAAAAKYADRGLSVIGIDVKESDDDVRHFRRIYRVQYPIAMDSRGILTHAVQAGGEHGIPASLFISPQGFLSCYLVGGFEGDELAGRIEALLPSSTPSPAP